MHDSAPRVISDSARYTVLSLLPSLFHVLHDYSQPLQQFNYSSKDFKRPASKLLVFLVN